MAHRVVLGESRFKARRRKRRILWVALVCISLLLVVGGSVFLARAAFLRITTIVILGASAVPAGDIQTSAQQRINGQYLWAYPKSNVFLYPKNTIVRGLLTQFPTLKSVEVNVENFHTLDVVVAERQPVALWCTDASFSACFLLDKNGLAYAPAPNYSGDVYKKYIGTNTDSALPWQYRTPQEFRSLSALVDAIAKNASASTVSGVSVDANDDVHVAFTNGFTLLFALHDDSGKIFERFGLALTAAPFAAHPLEDFQYLDLRFGDKLYYKLK